MTLTKYLKSQQKISYVTNNCLKVKLIVLMFLPGDIDATDCDTTLDSIYAIIDPTGALGHQKAPQEMPPQKSKTPPAGDNSEQMSTELQYGE